MRDVARTAGVSAKTVYSNFGSKAELFLAAIDVAVVGDLQPIPLGERPEFAVLAHGPLAERAAVGARLVGQIHERTYGIGKALREAAAAHADLDERLAEGEERRRVYAIVVPSHRDRRTGLIDDPRRLGERAAHAHSGLADAAG